MLPHQFRDNAPSQLGSSYGMKTTPLFPRQHNSPRRKGGEWEGNSQEDQASPNGGNSLKVSFLSLLNRRRKQISNIFSFSIQI